MVSWKVKALKTVVIGVSTVTGLAFVNTKQRLFAEESGNSFINIKRDTISAIPDNKLKGDDFGEFVLSLIQATRAARDSVQQTLTSNSYPGIVVGVSIKGEPCWVQGFGFADIESGARCTKNTVMRIASISKPLTMAAVAKLYEEGKLDLDKSIYDYLGDKFPVKKVNGKKVILSIRQLASHMAGIRHYQPHDEKDKLFKHYNKAMDAIELFANDELIAKPGTKFHYSTFGYTLIAAAVESVLSTGRSFGNYLVNDICRRAMGMNNTYLDENTPIILNRAKHYKRGNVLKNAPYVDCSYKYAGGGILSTIPDLLRFGNVMMYSYLPNQSKSSGFLKKSTVDMLWTPVPIEAIKMVPNLFEFCKYGLGWGLIRNSEPVCTAGACPPYKDMIFHNGSSTGGSSLLLIVPEKEMVVAIMCNVENARELESLGIKISQLFGDIILSPPVIISPKEISVKIQ